MKLEEAIKNIKKRINAWENIAEIGKATLSKEEYENSQSICEEQKLLLKELEHLQEKYDIDTHILQGQLDLANAKKIELQKENEELKSERNGYRAQVNSAFDNGFIHKDKVRELIENETIDISGFECIAVEDLQDLLKEE